MVLFAASTAGAAVFRVNVTGGADTGGCGSELAPCATIQHAIDLAANGDAILVAQGTYLGNANCDFGQFAVACIRKNLSLLGGFTSANWLEPDPDANTTVIDAQGTKRGVIVRGPAVTATVQGFTIRNGVTAGDAPQSGGGLVAFLADVTLLDLILQNNVADGVSNTQGSGGGVGILGSSTDISSATLERLTFTGNEARGGHGTNAQAGLGGGLMAVQAIVTGSQLHFENNKAIGGNLNGPGTPRPPNDGLGGGAAFTFGADVTIDGLTAINNTGTGGNGDTLNAGWGVGGGIYGEGFTTAPNLVKLTLTDAELRDNVIVGGVAPTPGGCAGGGLFSTGVELNFNRIAVIGNKAEGGSGGTGTAEGGGIAIWEPSTINTIRNSIFAKNEVKGGLGSSGGGLRVLASVLTLTHNSFVDNRFAAGFSGLGAGMAIGPQFPSGPTATLNANYSIIANHAGPASEDTVFIQGNGGVNATGNFNQNLFMGNTNDTNRVGDGSGFQVGIYNMAPDNLFPAGSATFFVNPATNDYHVQNVTPPVNSATNSPSEAVDFDGAARTAPRDIGADEFGAAAHRLSIRKLGAGTGLVTSAPGGISCGADCNEVFAENQIVNLTGDADPGFVFGGFGGDPDCGDNSVVVDADKQCDATFSAPPPGTIIVEKQTNPDGRLETFQFNGAINGSIADNQQLTLGNLAPGTYLVTEADHPLFHLTSIVCDDGNSSGSIGNLTATFQVEAGETVKCTFNNSLTTCSVGGSPDRVLPNQTVTTTVLEQACNSITAGPYTVGPPNGNVTFEALEIVLRDDFVVNGLFTARNNVP